MESIQKVIRKLLSELRNHIFTSYKPMNAFCNIIMRKIIFFFKRKNNTFFKRLKLSKYYLLL